METQPPQGLQATAAQLRAMKARGGDVVVSAGAGSGKTFVLVGRFMSLVADGTHPERLLTITFTEKAAHEMSERIGKALEREGFPDARRVAEGAWISTIHGFCARLLRERALEAGVDPAFAVLTSVPAARVRRAAFLRAQRSFRIDHPGLYDGLVERVRWGRDQDGVRQIRRTVFDLYDTIRCSERGLDALEALRLGAPALDRLCVAEVQVALEQLADAIRWLMSSIAGARKTLRLERQSMRISALSAQISSAPLDSFRIEVYRDLRALADTAKGGGPLGPELAAVRAAAERAAGAYAEGPARTLGRALEELLLRFDAEFRELKAEQSALDFTDLELRTRELLEDRRDVREDVQRRFEAVLVDEFQDTSRLQQRIVDLVRRPGGLFAVGDVKQSIYGFRHARVQGLLELERTVGEAGGEAVVLDTSFRTRPEILAWVDEVFDRVWSEPGSEVPHQSLQPGVAFGPVGRPCVELLVGRGESLARARNMEARAVAGRLATIVEGGQVRGTNPLRAESFGKPLRYRDCAILVPATTALYAYERALRERGVPYRVATGRGFYDVREVVDAVNLLRVTAAAHDDLAMLALLRSPGVGLSDEALVRLAGLRRRGGSLYEALRDVENDPELLEAGDLEGARGARALVDTLRGLRGRTSTRELLTRGLELSGLLDGSLLRSGDVRGFANLQKLLAIVDDLEREGVTGPGAVASVLEDLRASGAREAEANVSADDEDAVNVLTVHGAKGLEWPLVVVADLGRYQRPESDPIQWSDETGVIPNLRDPNDQKLAVTPGALTRLADLARERATEESKRLLYVAMTRARDHLVLAGAMSWKATRGGDWLRWSRAPLPPNSKDHLGTEQDVAAGGLARAIPASGGVVVRHLEVNDDQEGAPIQGPCGPAIGAEPVLGGSEAQALAREFVPPLPTVSPELEAEASDLLARVLAPGLPPLDQGASVYTVSEVLTWKTCARRALYRYVVGDEEPWEDEQRVAAGVGERDWVPADVRGTLAHDLLARAMKGTRPSLAWTRRRLKQLLLPAAVTEEAITEASKRAQVLSRRFEESPLGRRARATQGTRCEYPFLVKPKTGGANPPLPSRTGAPLPFTPPADVDLLLRGTVDLLTPGDGGGWILADYKAGEITALEVPGRLPLHELQARLYALALQDLGVDLRIEAAYVVYLAPEVIISVDLSESALEEARELLAAFATARRTLDLRAEPGQHCRHCPWLDLCPDGLDPSRSPAATQPDSVLAQPLPSVSLGRP